MNYISVTVQLDEITEVVENNGYQWQSVAVSIPGNKKENTTKLRLMICKDTDEELISTVEALAPKEKFIVFGDIYFTKTKTAPLDIRVTNLVKDLPSSMPMLNELILADAYFSETDVKEGKLGQKSTKIGVNLDRLSEDDCKTYFTLEAFGSMADKLEQRHAIRAQFQRKVVVRGAIREWYPEGSEEYGPKRYLTLESLTNPADSTSSAQRSGGKGTIKVRSTPDLSDFPS